MNEQIQEQQITQNVEAKQNNFLSFRLHKKLAILMFVGLFFLAFGVSAFYLGKQSVNTIQVPNPSPTYVITRPSIYPTIDNKVLPTVSSIQKLDIDCVTDSDCPRAFASTGQYCLKGKCVMDDKQPESKQPTPTSSPTLNIDQVCKKDSDCQIYGAGPNCQNSENCPPNYYEGTCISGKCVY